MNGALRHGVAVSTNYLRFGTSLLAVLLVTPIAVGVLGTHGFGLWSLAVASIGLVGLLEAGLATTALRFAGAAEGAGRPADRNRYLSALTAIAVPVGTVIAIAAAIVAPWLAGLLGLHAEDAGEFTLLVRLGGLALGLALPAATWRAALVARGDLPLANLIDATAILAGAATTAAGLTNDWGLRAMIAGFCVTTIAPALLYVPVASRRCPSLKLSLRNAPLSTLREMRGFAGAATVANTANLAALRCEPMIVKGFMPMAMVGQYAVAARIAEYLLAMAKQFANALTPAVARAHGGGDAASIRGILLTGTGTVFALTVLCASVLGHQAEDLLTAWLGPEFAGSAPALRWLLAAAAVSSLSMNAASVLGMTGRHRRVAIACSLAAALRLGGGALLIGRVGLEGPGVAALLSAIVVETLLVLRPACRQVGVHAADFLRSAVLPALVGCLALWLAASALPAWLSGHGWSDILLRSTWFAIVFVAAAFSSSRLAPWWRSTAPVAGLVLEARR